MKNIPFPLFSNIWIRKSADYVSCIDDLLRNHARTKFLTLEPLLGPLPRLRLGGIDCAIVDGESGPRSRPMEEAWVLEFRRQCETACAAFFFKQWGGVNKKKTGRVLEVRTWDAMPSVG